MNSYRKASTTPGPGFLGSTSSSADYIGAQSQHGFGELVEIDDPLSAGLGNVDHFPIYSQHHINLGTTVLSHFLEFPFFESFINDLRKHSLGTSLISPWITYICDSIKRDLCEPLLQSWDQVGDSHQHDRRQEHLSRRIFSNTSAALEYNGQCSLQHFASLFTGENLRWEAVGMFFTGVGLGAINVQILRDQDARGSRGLSSKQRAVLARRMLEAGQICLSFCEKTGHYVEPEIWLSFELAHLASVVDGDSSMRIPRSQFAELTAPQATRHGGS